MTPVALRQVPPPGVATLVRGDVRELEALGAAALLAQVTLTPVVACVLPVRPLAGLGLLRAVAGDLVGRWESWDDTAARAAAGRVAAMVVSGATWRAVARTVWPALASCPVYVQRRPPSLPGHVLVAVDSPRTLEALARRLAPLTARPGLRLTLAYASVPTWAASLCTVAGCPVFAGCPSEDDFPWPLPAPGATGVCVPATPTWGIRALAAELGPDLVVLGLHRHRLRTPLLAHPTAWLLSRELPTDVLLCPVGEPPPA